MLNDFSPMPNLGVGLRLFLLTDIIASAAGHKQYYEDALIKDQRAIRLICGVLKVVGLLLTNIQGGARKTADLKWPPFFLFFHLIS